MNLISSYHDFFVASTGAAAAFIGLLFVGLSFIDSGAVAETTKTWRRIIANSAFSQLTDVFFVSIAGLLPDPHNVAFVGSVMAVFGLLVSLRLLLPTLDSEKTGRNRPTILGILAVGIYVLQLVTSIGLLRNPNSQTVYSYFILALILLYAGALARAWEITGAKSR